MFKAYAFGQSGASEVRKSRSAILTRMPARSTLEILRGNFKFTLQKAQLAVSRGTRSCFVAHPPCIAGSQFLPWATENLGDALRASRHG